MRRAIQLGKNALGSAGPNPMVGCVVVHDNKIIGEGYTSAYGGAHAEVNAINAVEDSALLKEATLYVTLEPCSHYGKTPPCSDLIIEKQLKNVVIGLQDPNPKVAGSGIKKLKQSGCEVAVGILEKECLEHHKRFLTFQHKNRPYIILKWAESADGFIAPNKDMRTKNPEPFWITNRKSRQLVHKWRSEEMAILVGTNTVLDDNPRLDVRYWQGKNPIRLVLDRTLKIAEDSHVLDGSIETVVFTEIKKESKQTKLSYRKIDFKADIASQICEVAFELEINSLIVEGGTKTLQTFIDGGFWDEARIFKGQKEFYSGIIAPKLSGSKIGQKSILGDQLILFRND